MPAATESVSVLSRALDQTGDVLTAVHAEHLMLPTPCAEWDVARLVTHVVQSPRAFLALGRGEEVDWMAEPEPVLSNWAATFRSAGDDLLHFWHQAGDGVAPGQVDWQTTEFAVHTWDLARAIDYPGALDPGVAERALAFMSASLADENRDGAFHAEVSVPADAPVHDRLAAFAGRSPGWAVSPGAASTGR